MRCYPIFKLFNQLIFISLSNVQNILKNDEQANCIFDWNMRVNVVKGAANVLFYMH